VSKKSKNTPPSDTNLLETYLQTGNIEVLGELYNRYIHLVYGVCLKYLKNREDSKDAVNKIFEKLITELSKYNIENFRSWLYVVVKNFCRMELRKKQTQQKHFDTYSRHLFMESTSFLHPIDEERDDMLEEKLKQCIEKLKKQQRTCIEMFYFEQKCYQEISQALQLQNNKVKSYIQNGRRNLKICLEKDTQDDEK